MLRFAPAITLFLIAQVAAQDGLQFSGPSSGKVGKPITLSVTGLPPIDFEKPIQENLAWQPKFALKTNAPEGATVEAKPKLSIDFLSKSWVMEVALTCDKPGAIVVVAAMHSDSPSIAIHRCNLASEGPTPPPDPGPSPKPTPTALPFSAPGWACLIIKEASQTGALPASQVSIFTSQEVAKFVHSAAVKLDDGQPFYRCWDDDYDDSMLTNAPVPLVKAYKDVLKQANGKTPWIAITNGKDKGFSGPLPLNVSDTIKLMQEHM